MLHCDQCGATLEFQGSRDKPDAGAMPCGTCFEIVQCLLEWQNPSAWMRCDDCHHIVTVSPAAITAHTPKRPHPLVEASVLLGIAEEIALGIAPIHSTEQLRRIMRHAPQEGATLQWLIRQPVRKTSSKLFADIGHGLADSKQLKAWKRDPVRGLEAAKAHGKSLLDAALMAWSRRYPALPSVSQSRLGAKDWGRSIIVFDLSCYDNPEWLSWKKVKKSIQEFDRQSSLRHSTACNTATRVSDVANESSDCPLRPLPESPTP